MKTLVLLFALTVLSHSDLSNAASPQKKIPFTLPPQFLTFYYQSMDGSVRLPCIHRIENEPSHDWLVRCGNGQRAAKLFSVHLLINKYIAPTAPRASYEILYWLTDRHAKSGSQFTSGTTWLRFEDDAGLHSLRLSQSVENDYANLWLEVRPAR